MMNVWGALYVTVITLIFLTKKSETFTVATFFTLEKCNCCFKIKDMRSDKVSKSIPFPPNKTRRHCVPPRCIKKHSIFTYCISPQKKDQTAVYFPNKKDLLVPSL